jgi:hypothetical protein
VSLEIFFQGVDQLSDEGPDRPNQLFRALFFIASTLCRISI